jgi:hypothetical protein
LSTAMRQLSVMGGPGGQLVKEPRAQLPRAIKPKAIRLD